MLVLNCEHSGREGYVARIEFDDEAGVFHGEVLNLRDVVTFEGKTVAQMRRAFRDSVDDYLAFCAERNDPPDKPHSGRFVVRIDPALHRAIATRATSENMSLNSWVQEVLQDALEKATSHADVRVNKSLNASLRRGLRDAKARRGRFV